MFTRWYLDLWKKDDGSGPLLGSVLIYFWPVTGVILAADAVIEGTKLTAKGVGAVAGAIGDSRRAAAFDANDRKLALIKARQDAEESRERISRENRYLVVQEKKVEKARPRDRMEILEEIHREYLENLEIAESIDDPATSLAIRSQVDARLRMRLARLIG